MEISLARVEHIEDLSELFDRYRIFYNQSSNLKAARKFLEDRFHNHDSIIFVANDNSQMVGFTQLYPSFSSVSMQRIWILNDLFVRETYRGRGAAKLLMDAAEKYARETSAVRVVLATQVSNTVAQSLYESRGYIRDEKFYHYTLNL
jgi:ribosomal protein S18 acetylase RimI-like enzyme